MSKYQVILEEKFLKVVEVKASDEKSAILQTYEKYITGDICLTHDDLIISNVKINSSKSKMQKGSDSMFYCNIQEDINSLVSKELESAKKEHGNSFSSYHEFFAVLKEENQECEEELNSAKICMDKLWQAIKTDNNAETVDQINRTRDRLYYAASEIIQQIAVCDKALAGILNQV